MLDLMGCGASSRTSSPAFHDEVVRGKTDRTTSGNGRPEDLVVRGTTRPREDRLTFRYKRDDMLNSSSKHRNRYRYHHAKNHGKYSINIYLKLSVITNNFYNHHKKT